jgi:hypothetical protein
LGRAAVLGLIMGAIGASLASAADRDTWGIAPVPRFAVSHCDYKTGQGCPEPPAAGSCHFAGILQDRSCTPGALNPAVMPSKIKQTICKSGWTSTVRPPTSYTGPLKTKLMRAYGVGGRSPAGFELDHLI